MMYPTVIEKYITSFHLTVTIVIGRRVTQLDLFIHNKRKVLR